MRNVHGNRGAWWLSATSKFHFDELAIDATGESAARANALWRELGVPSRLAVAQVSQS
jgi:hypothetical protein